MTESRELFFELLLVSTGARESLQHPYTETQWNEARLIAQEQSVVGVLMTAIERLPKEQYPPRTALMQWIGLSEMTEGNSRKITEAGKTVIGFFREHGFPCEILKGSSVARYYPQPLRRTSGDIDVWLDGGREKIYAFARDFDKDGQLYGVNYHHIHFHLLEDVHIEVHIWPSFLSSPLRNSRLHKFANEHRPTMESDSPSLDFDRVFILLHCYRHMCGHGLGLRQIMDYFYVLRQGFDDVQKQESAQWIEKLGMGRFCRGIMWVLQKYFGLEDRFLLMSPDEREGRFIMREVLMTGNMGHSDTRNWGSTKTPLSRFFFNLRRDLYLARHYPHESLWQPFFSLWLYFWRMAKGLLKDKNE